MVFGVVALIVALVALFISVLALALSAVALDRWWWVRRHQHPQEPEEPTQGDA